MASIYKRKNANGTTVWRAVVRINGYPTFCTLAAAKGASNLQLQTATSHRTLKMLSHYTHMDVQVTKQFSNQISDQILKGVPL